MSDSNFLDQSVIVDGARTAIGARFKSLKGLSAAQLGGCVIKELIARNTISLSDIDEVIVGNTVSAGAGQNIAKQAAYHAGLPAVTPAYTVNNVCGSGMQSMILAAQSIGCGQASVVIAASTESATHCPSISKKDASAVTDSLVLDGLWCQMCDKHMGEIAELTAQQYHISRADQDRFAFGSHQKAIRAQNTKAFADEIAPVTVPGGAAFAVDEKPRRTTTLEKLAALPAAFVENGTVTAGNSCSPCDGAAAVMLASGEAAQRLGLEPMARIRGYATVFDAPEMTFTTAIGSITQCLKKCGLSVDDVDLFEISEAFAVQAVFTRDTLKIPDEKINVYGGDIALGHPLGAAGTRIIVTLLHALRRQKKKRGIAAVCFGSGGSIAMMIELMP